MKNGRLDFIARRLRESRLGELVQERTRAALHATDRVRGLFERGAQSRAPNVREAPSAPPSAPAASTGNSLADHLGVVVEKRLDKLMQSRQWRTSNDPVEAVHDLRVASRRLRAFVSVFTPLLDSEVLDRTEKPLRRITRAARSVRDLDVHMELLVDRLERAATDRERAALEHLLEHLETGRERIRRRAEKRLARIDFDDLRLWISAALGETVARLPHDQAAAGALAEDLIQPLIKRASKDRPANDGMEYPDDMHKLRIDLKKLRYGIELFEPVFGAHYQTLYERVEALQELLGKHHDLVVLSDIVEDNKKKLEQKGRHTLLDGLATVGDQLLRERRQLLARFRSDGFEPEWWEKSVQNALASA